MKSFRICKILKWEICVGFGSSKLSLNDTIYALSSGVNTAISIVRISGTHAYKSLHLLSQKRNSLIALQSEEVLKRLKIQPRMVHLRRFYNKNYKIIDQGLVIYFPSSSSYNKEELIEFHLHGGKTIVAAIFEQLRAMGMRMAFRGQFTKRAVINGRIGLHQAQAIHDLIHSQTQFSRQVAINHLLGKNTDFLGKLRQDLVSCLAKNEAYIDFQQSESDVKETLFQQTKQSASSILNRVKRIIKNYKNLQIVKDGVKVSIYGRPNVGKSTLMNQLSQKEVSIVNSEAGTTRDVIQTSIEVAGCKITLCDTAGLREQVSSMIENQGIRRAKQAIVNSHFQILMIDWQQEKHYIQDNLLIICDPVVQSLQQLYQNTIILVNKSDLLPKNVNCVQIRSKDVPKSTPLLISVQNSHGIIQLENTIREKITSKFKIYQNSEEIYFTRQRYFDALIQCQQEIEQYILQRQPDLACEHLRQSIKVIEQIFGRVDSEDVLDIIFRDFCIGK